jgi:hypothetical protein
MSAPLCFIFTTSHRDYEESLAPAAHDAGLEPWRPSLEAAPDEIFEQMLLCPFAVVDVTREDATAYYGLGMRRAQRPGTTVVIAAGAAPEWLDAIRYSAIPPREAIAEALKQRRNSARRHSIFSLLELATDHAKTDIFREEARKRGDGGGQAGVLVDRLLSYRAVSAWSDMVELTAKMPLPLAQTALVREQTAWALNRLHRREEAESVLRELLEEKGPSSEACAILGRIYKDQWDETRERRWLDQAIGAYLAGFEADWRDAYPGINAVTLMELADPPDERRTEILPLVRYAVERKIAKDNPDYWDYATLLELAILGEDRSKAEKNLTQALAAIREKWEPETTARNLRLIREARERRGAGAEWPKDIERALLSRTRG